ncbi:hypothetical protein BLNAU_24987 [Blattamonas nauphoetae]|uniref:Uncharacterized protein n=1 Tax=Blattamonas nauphoetae TaxID=2049346 RepID=A0ABQ9WNQ3_9EUKA|nr:hypothetical protein BLNAU_24987 [Blattamonas nauphoetae]
MSMHWRNQSDASCIVFRFELAGYHADDIQVAIVDDEILRWIYLQAGRTQQLFEPDLDTPNELLFPTAFLHSSCAIRVVLVTNKDHGEELEFWSLEGNQVAIEVGAALAMDEIKPDVSWKMVQRDGRQLENIPVMNTSEVIDDQDIMHDILKILHDAVKLTIVNVKEKLFNMSFSLLIEVEDRPVNKTNIWRMYESPYVHPSAFMSISCVSLRSATVRQTDFLQPFIRKDNDHTTDDIIQLPHTKMNIYVRLTSDLFNKTLSLAYSLSEMQHSLSPSENRTRSRNYKLRVLFASICSSIVRASRIEFLRSGWGPLMTLERTEEFSNLDSSITLTSCVTHSKSGRMGALLSDTRGFELGDTRLNITTHTTIISCTFQHLTYTTSEPKDGGSALILTVGWTILLTKSNIESVGGCILLMGSSSKYIQSSLSVSSCSFADWYPGAVTNRDQFGGGVGITYTSATHSIVDSNFTLSGSKTQSLNGGFIVPC